MAQHVNFIEVGPRDGFQNVKDYIPVDIKVKLIDDLLAAGVRRMEMTSFVSPKAIPQMRDAAEVVCRTLETHVAVILYNFYTWYGPQRKKVKHFFPFIRGMVAYTNGKYLIFSLFFFNSLRRAVGAK